MRPIALYIDTTRWNITLGRGATSLGRCLEQATLSAGGEQRATDLCCGMPPAVVAPQDTEPNSRGGCVPLLRQSCRVRLRTPGSQNVGVPRHVDVYKRVRRSSVVGEVHNDSPSGFGSPSP